ncbi:hypothetical protein TEA_002613 [Camellia sinensis var. sinensis]|uniref:Cytochrome c-552/DMSO reductase-like haem-binding domain-containing protein n=1 Tax=Camellia sinensis var. sinensis TaxID=542762 RepID=A0A4S4E534_CAMSN|nr:hypothetical protein TEA_002613 [Camellia sinensis var. sinensis]
MLRLLLLLVLFLVSGSTLVDSHKESGDWSCESDPEARVAAEFSPGLVTLDGHADDWKNVDGFEFSLLPALDPHPDHEYKGGKMIVKALHDGKDVYFMLQIDGDYVYSKGSDPFFIIANQGLHIYSDMGLMVEMHMNLQLVKEMRINPMRFGFGFGFAYRFVSSTALVYIITCDLMFSCVSLMMKWINEIERAEKGAPKELSPSAFTHMVMLRYNGSVSESCRDGTKCPSVALMFQVGESATYHDMGGCKESPTTCNSASCHGYEVDIMHFSIGNAVPGRLYGGNPIDNKDGTGGDRFGHLVDVYAWNPHCRNLDGISPSGPSGSQLFPILEAVSDGISVLPGLLPVTLEDGPR